MQLDRIVVGVDFSAPAMEAARWVVGHFAPDAEVILVYSIEVPRPPDFLGSLLPPRDELIDTLRAGGRERLDDLARTLGGDRVSTEVRVGQPASTLTDVAEEFAADLIVVGEHGRHLGLGMLLGSTAEQLVRRAPVPVLLARGLPAGPPRTLLLPIEPSEMSERVLAWGTFLRNRFDAEAVGLHAVSPMLYGRVSVISSVPRARQLEAAMLANASTWLGDRLRAAGLPSDNAHVATMIGDPGHEINAAVQRFDVDLVIMGSRNDGAAGRLLLGSTAGTVLRGAACPVLVLHDGAQA